jgi:hypothetical protein
MKNRFHLFFKNVQKRIEKMNQTGPNAKEVKLLGNGNRGAIPLLTEGRTAPTRLITAGEKAMLAAAAADAALRKSCPPPEKAPAKEGECPNSEASGWTKVVGHAF